MTDGPQLPGLVLVQRLGSGGFSDVYLYERDRPRIKVAVKVLKPHALDEAGFRQFMAEAEAMAELAEHPYIVPVLGSGTTPDGLPYLEMRYYPPPDLAARVKQQPMTVPEALKTGIQLASAIETAHRANIIHRDIKPGNVLMSSYGVPGLTDFGIAGKPGETLDNDDAVGVSMPWSPPEVLTGTSNGSRASDVYSLAATVWHLMVGRAPFSMPGGDNTERGTFARILHSKPPSLGRADAPNSLDRLLQMAMSKDPALRPQTALEFARQLQRVEQELRLARTEIVVLDAPAHHGPPPTPTGAPSAAPAQAIPADATMLKAPPSVSPSGNRPVAAGPAATTRRPISASPSAPEASGADATVRPPQRPTHKAGETALRPGVAETGDTDEAHRRGPGIFIAATIVLVMAIIGVGIYLVTGNKAKTNDATLPKAPGPTSIGDVLGGGQAVPNPPNVTGAVNGTNAVFTWQAVNGETYKILVDGSQTPTTQATNTFTTPMGSAAKVCVSVYAYQNNVVSQAAGQACASK